MKCYLISISMMLMAFFGQAQTEVKNFTLPNALNGKTVSLDQYNSMNGVVIIFFSNECPYDNYYKERIKALLSSYGAKVQFLLINAHQEPEESIEKMAIHYGDLGIPYLADKDQLVMNDLGARKSPEVFLLKSNGGKFSVFYNGAIDDNAQVEKDVSTSYLKNAIDQLLNNQPAPESNRAVGCSIRKK